MTQTARARNLVPADRQTADPGCWERLRTGEKTRSIQAKARLAAYAAHPSTSRRSTSSGFVMLTAGEQAEVDADHTREEPGLGVEEDQPPAGSDCPQVRRKGAPRPQQTGYIREERLTSGQALFVVSHLYARTSSPNWGRVFPRFREDPLVELRGLEPLTPCMPCRCATSCATAPHDCSCGAPRGGDRVSLSGTPRHLPNRGTHRGFAPTFQVTIRQALAYSCTSAQ
jgi:hypothetical protein